MVKHQQPAAQRTPTQRIATAPTRLHSAANDNYDNARLRNLPLSDPSRQPRDNAIRRARSHGAKIADLVARFGLHEGTIRRVCNFHPAIAESHDRVVRMMPVLGAAGSTTCYYQPVSLPRVAFIDGPYLGLAA